VRRWRVRFVRRPNAPFEAEPWETLVRTDSYSVAVTVAGKNLVRAFDGDKANRLYWEVVAVELVQEPLSGPGSRHRVAGTA